MKTEQITVLKAIEADLLGQLDPVILRNLDLVRALLAGLNDAHKPRTVIYPTARALEIHTESTYPAKEDYTWPEYVRALLKQHGGKVTSSELAKIAQAANPAVPEEKIKSQVGYHLSKLGQNGEIVVVSQNSKKTGNLYEYKK